MAKFKRCTKCKGLKPLAGFHKDKAQKSGYSPRCKKCRAKYAKEFRESSKGKKWKDYAKKPHIRERSKKRSKRYRESGKKKISARKYNHSAKGHKYQLKKYDLTLEQYAQMLLDQKGVCKICGLPETRFAGGKITNLSVDHDHETNVVRGLLCHFCNMMLGMAKDNLEILNNAVKYLKENKSSHASQ